MRQGQNSKRSRGRGRKVQNATNRSYDSNGPDVKIRGTAAHICEKYQQLARDAQSSGDRVAAENLLQHAEHYYRLLMASQGGQDVQQRQHNQLGYRPVDDENYDEYEEASSSSSQSVTAHAPAEATPEAQPEVKPNGAAETSSEDNEGEAEEEAPKRRQPRRRRPRYQAGEGEQPPAAPRARRSRSTANSSDEAEGEKPSEKPRASRAGKSSEPVSA